MGRQDPDPEDVSQEESSEWKIGGRREDTQREEDVSAQRWTAGVKGREFT